MSPASHWEDQNSRAHEMHSDALMHLLLKQAALIPTEMYHVYLYFTVYNVLWAQKAQFSRTGERGSQRDPWQQYSSSTEWGPATSHWFCWVFAEYTGWGCQESQSLGYKVGKSNASWSTTTQPSDLPTWSWAPHLVLGGPVCTGWVLNPARPTEQANSNNL